MNPSQNPQRPQQIELTLGQPQQLQLALEQSQPQWTPEELEKARRFEDLCAQALRRYQEAKQVSSSPEASLIDEKPSPPSASPSSIKSSNSPEEREKARIQEAAIEGMKDWILQGYAQVDPDNPEFSINPNHPRPPDIRR